VQVFWEAVVRSAEEYIAVDGMLPQMKLLQVTKEIQEHDEEDNGTG
jgi:hypothetical protein